MFNVLRWIVIPIVVLYLATRSVGKRFADDLILTLTKAHLGKLPEGKYAEQYVSAKTFSRDELRAPLDAETLRRMDACVTVHRHDVQLRSVRVRKGVLSNPTTIYLSMSLQFDGELADGEKVHVSIDRALLCAYVDRDKVRGMALQTLKEVKS